MAQKITINVDNPNDVIDGYGAAPLVRLERSTAADSGFAEILTETVLADTSQYELWDSTGSSSHYYRTRYSSANGSISSEYSAAFRAGSLAAYATIDDVSETMNISEGDTRAYNLMADLLVDASDAISQMCHRTFFRSPQVSGTEARVFHVLRNHELLSQASGRTLDLVSLSLVELADDLDSSYSTIATGSTGYYLLPHVLADPAYPSEDVQLSRLGSNVYFPKGGLVRLTGVFGWASVPPLVKRATIDLAREWYRMAIGGDGPLGETADDLSLVRPGMPPSLRMLTKSSYRFRNVMTVIN